MHRLKRKQKSKKKILQCIHYTGINKKIPHKIVRKIGIKNVTWFFQVNFY